MNIDAKSLNQILGNQIQHYIERFTHHDYSKDARIIHHPQIIDVMCHINKMKDKNRMIILIDAENLTKFKFFFTVKLSKNGIWGNAPQYSMVPILEAHSIIILNGKS